jgi:hypothetical protein
MYVFPACNALKGTADGGTVVKVLRYKSEGRWFDENRILKKEKINKKIPDSVIGIFH